MSIEFEKFAAYLKVTDKMIERATKDEIADAARILALELAHYRARFGETSAKKAYELLVAETINDEQAGEMAEGFVVLIKTMYALRSSHAQADPQTLL